MPPQLPRSMTSFSKNTALVYIWLFSHFNLHKLSHLHVCSIVVLDAPFCIQPIAQELNQCSRLNCYALFQLACRVDRRVRCRLHVGEISPVAGSTKVSGATGHGAEVSRSIARQEQMKQRMRGRSLNQGLACLQPYILSSCSRPSVHWSKRAC
jgi:hypothetical protein